MDQVSVDQLSSTFDVTYIPDLFSNRTNLLTEIENAEAIIVRNQTQVDNDLLSAAPHLKVVGRLGVGLDNIDLISCELKNITVIPASGANANAVAEYVLSTALILMRQAYNSTEEIIAGAWPRKALSQGLELSGKNLGLIGFGQISQQVAAKASAFNMNLSAYDPYLSKDSPLWDQYKVAPVTFEDILKNSDVISLHIPLNEKTHNLFSLATFKKMRSEAILINSARGGIVNEEDIRSALRDKIISGAALDVFEQEPPKNVELFSDLKNIILTPHIAGVSFQSNQRVSQLIAEKISQFLLENQK